MKTIYISIVFILLISTAFAGREVRIGDLKGQDVSDWVVCSQKSIIYDSQKNYVSYRDSEWAEHYLTKTDLKKVFLQGETVEVVEQGVVLHIGPRSTEPNLPNTFFKNFLFGCVFTGFGSGTLMVFLFSNRPRESS